MQSADPPTQPSTDELARAREELSRLRRELEDTNRGVVALHAELDDRSERLRHAAELKSRLLYNMTHEFRTPVNAIVGLCDLLDRRVAAEETSFIRKAALDLREMVDDLLELAKFEAGKSAVHAADVNVQDIFGGLRGLMKPMLLNGAVDLTLDAEAELPSMFTDGAKVSQILRNLISNGLKFTERGAVRVTARRVGDSMEFAVADTGAGIAPQDQSAIFDEFVQLPQRAGVRAQGTGLGLPLSRRLAELLGGTLTVASRLGAGSTFTLRLPLRTT